MPTLKYSATSVTGAIQQANDVINGWTNARIAEENARAAHAESEQLAQGQIQQAQTLTYISGNVDGIASSIGAAAANAADAANAARAAGLTTDRVLNEVLTTKDYATWCFDLVGSIFNLFLGLPPLTAQGLADFDAWVATVNLDRTLTDDVPFAGWIETVGTHGATRIVCNPHWLLKQTKGIGDALAGALAAQAAAEGVLTAAEEASTASQGAETKADLAATNAEKVRALVETVRDALGTGYSLDAAGVATFDAEKASGLVDGTGLIVKRKVGEEWGVALNPKLLTVRSPSGDTTDSLPQLLVDILTAAAVIYGKGN